MTRMIAGNPSGKEIANMLASVGLAQNFAAIRALSLEGIQKGHMNLHAKNIALSAGVPLHLIGEAVSFMKSRGRINVETAQDYLEAHNVYSQVNKHKKKSLVQETELSSFYIKIEEDETKEPLILNLILDTPDGMTPIHLSIEKKNPDDTIVKSIFGKHSYQWIAKFIVLLENFPPLIQTDQLSQSNTLPIRSKLKLIVICINFVTTTILKANKQMGIEIIDSIYSLCMGNQVEYSIPSNLFFLHNLLTELLATYKYYIGEKVKNPFLKEAIIMDVMETLKGLKESYR